LSTFIGYIRQSREKDSDISPEMQRDAIKHWSSAPGKGRKIKFLAPDRDWSGKSLDRPSMREALALLRAGKADGIVVSKLDRLTRSIRDLANLIEESRKAGWTIICLDLGGETVDFSTKTGKMIAYMTGMFSEWYLDGVTEEWAKVRAHKIEAGHHWGAPPLGYRRGVIVNGKGIEQPGALVVDSEWAPVVQEVFARRARANGSRASWRDLQTYLNSAGAPTFREKAAAAREERAEEGSSWGLSTVMALVANRAYRGEARAGELVNEGAHPALVDEQTFRAANRKGQAFGHGKRDGTGPMLGHGFLKCSCGCGGTLYRKPGNSGHLSYASREIGCVGNSIGAVKIEGYVVEQLIAELHRKEADGSGGLAARTGGNPDAERMTARVAELDGEESETDAAEASGDISRIEAAKLRSSIERERDELVQKLAEIGPVDDAGIAMVPAAHMESVLPGMPPADVGAILRAAFASCVVSPANGAKNLPASARVTLTVRT
jgi:DNA invertase Pin-like site-specific DNA recombinase